MLCKDKLPEFTGDKLTAWGDESQLSWGTWIGLSWGSIELYWSCSSTEPSLIPWSDRTIRLFRQLFIAPVSNVTCN